MPWLKIDKKVPFVIYDDFETILEKSWKHNCKGIDYAKVKGDCNFTGKYRGWTYCICNLRFVAPRDIFIILHNGSDYNFHLMVKHLSEKLKEHKFTCMFMQKCRKIQKFFRNLKKDWKKKILNVIWNL